MASVKLLIIVALFCFVSANANATVATKTSNPIISYPKDANGNQIPYFDNRFRFDAEVDEATLIFFRRRGTPPVILVQPDGSKLRVNDYPKDRVEWFDDQSFDMIKITKPTPGPWQALGDILPNSEILVVSTVSIDVEPLPTLLMSGETLKITGKLLNGGEHIKEKNFSDVVALDVTFTSTNNADYENFGSGTVEVGRFVDDGRDLDEYANDGVFTGEFLLTIPPGEWAPKYSVKLPMITREQKQDLILLKPNPITISVEATDVMGDNHILTFDVDDRYVDVESMVFQGKLIYPNLETESFSLLEPSKEARTIAYENKDAGIHRVTVSAFGKTIDGREFSLSIPEFTFNVKLPPLTATEDEVNEDSSLESVDEIAQLLEQQPVEEVVIEPKDNTWTWIYIALGNLIILLLGGFLAWWYLVRKPKVK